MPFARAVSARCVNVRFHHGRRVTLGRNAVEHDLDAVGFESITRIQITTLDRIGSRSGTAPESRSPGDAAQHTLFQLAPISEHRVRLQSFLANAGIAERSDTD